MNLKSPYISIEGITFTLPFVLYMSFFTKKSAYLAFSKDSELTKRQVFFRDFFLINYSFVLAGFLSLLFQYDNSDARAWWPLFVYLNYFYGVVFSLLFAFIGKLLQAHKVYTLNFSIVILFMLTLTKYWNYSLGYYHLESYFIFLTAIIVLHLFLCMAFKFNSKC